MDGLVTVHGDQLALGECFKTDHRPHKTEVRMGHHMGPEQLKTPGRSDWMCRPLDEPEMPEETQGDRQSQIGRALLEMLPAFGHQCRSGVAVGLPMAAMLDDRRARAQPLRHHQMHRWGGQPLPLNASAWVRDTTAQPVADYLFVRLRGAMAAVQAATTRMAADTVAQGAQVTVMDNTEAANDWRASGEQTLQFFEAPAPDACLWRLSVPQTAPVLDLPGLDHPSQYIEWQGAQRWLWAPASAAVPLRELAQSVGGHASLFRASTTHAEVDKVAGVNTPLDAVQERIQRQLQQQFDPKGVFATGRMHPL